MIALFNEVMVSVYLYLMISLTDFHGENPLRSEIGYALLFLVVFTVLVNFLKALWLAIASLKCTKKLLLFIKRRQTSRSAQSASSPVDPPTIL